MCAHRIYGRTGVLVGGNEAGRAGSRQAPRRRLGIARLSRAVDSSRLQEQTSE
jgi:hypothetical protein